MHKLDHRNPQALHGAEATRRLEHAAQAVLPPNTLMQRAGLAVAKLALALAPHSRRIWVACGPGNNGGDGIEAAIHLQRWGKQPVVTWLGDTAVAPQDARNAYQRAASAGVTFSKTPPDHADFCIDALLGLGVRLRTPDNRMAEWITHMNAGSAPILAVDLPSGLHADTGITSTIHVKVQNTLSLLTLKPGLFTASGRDAAGEVWLDDLGLSAAAVDTHTTFHPATAWLAGAPHPTDRPHASHKGSYGDVAVIGGARGMTGAAMLAASSALNSGSGRVFVSLLQDDGLTFDYCQPELMFRTPDSLDLTHLTVVCGCGGGEVIQHHLTRILTESNSTVLDADALNAIASHPPFQALLSARAERMARTVLTPHPLEAARLLNSTVVEVQSDRLAAAQKLAQRFACVVVLKGSGTVIAEPDKIPFINPTGNAALATGGTGDVLAGMIGARLASGHGASEAAREAVYRHGLQADEWPLKHILTASALCRSVQK